MEQGGQLINVTGEQLFENGSDIYVVCLVKKISLGGHGMYFLVM